jgi:cyclin H
MTTATGPSRSKWDTSTSGAAGASTSASGAASGSATPAVSRPSPGPTPFHGTSQFKHWRYSRSGLAKLRAELNEKSKEVTARNMAEEKAAQQSLGHEFKDPPPPAAYLSVEDELLLVRFYCAQCSRIARALALTDMAEGTAISYLKRFYLKNSVMEWHPKNIM